MHVVGTFAAMHRHGARCVDAATARQYADIGVHRLVLQPVTEDGSDMEDLIESAGQTLIGRI